MPAGFKPAFDKDGRRKRNKLRVIDLEDGGEDLGLALFSALPASLETKSLFWTAR